MSKKTGERKRAVDFTLLMATLVLVFIGIIMVFSASWPEAMKDFGSGYYFLKRQIFAASLGLIGLLFTMNIDYKIYKKYSLLIFIMSLMTVVLLFTPMGKTLKGARRWVNLGFTTFMPSDIVKIGSIIFFASFLSNKGDNIKKFKSGTLPSLIIIAISCGAIMIQRDLGTTITLGLTLMGMFFIGGMNIVLLISLVSPVIAIIGLFFLRPGFVDFLTEVFSGTDNEYRLNRIIAFKDPFAYRQNIGYQAVQSLFALGSGGLFGLGLGKSRQKFFYIPESYNDFIFSIIGEELGFVGTLSVIIIFMILIWRGIQIALNIDDNFGSLVATGITALITVQTLIHIAVVTSSIPTTGITLPFISYGGTSLAVYMSAIGILLNISRYANFDRS